MPSCAPITSIGSTRIFYTPLPTKARDRCVRPARRRRHRPQLSDQQQRPAPHVQRDHSAGRLQAAQSSHSRRELPRSRIFAETSSARPRTPALDTDRRPRSNIRSSRISAEQSAGRLSIMNATAAAVVRLIAERSWTRIVWRMDAECAGVEDRAGVRASRRRLFREMREV